MSRRVNEVGTLASKHIRSKLILRGVVDDGGRRSRNSRQERTLDDASFHRLPTRVDDGETRLDASCSEWHSANFGVPQNFHPVFGSMSYATAASVGLDIPESLPKYDIDRLTMTCSPVASLHSHVYCDDCIADDDLNKYKSTRVMELERKSITAKGIRQRQRRQRRRQERRTAFHEYYSNSQHSQYD